MKRILALVATTALMVAMLSMSASAALIFTGGLVYMIIVDAVDVEDATVQVPVAAAVNICVISIIADDDGNITSCTTEADSRANR